MRRGEEQRGQEEADEQAGACRGGAAKLARGGADEDCEEAEYKLQNADGEDVVYAEHGHGCREE